MSQPEAGFSPRGSVIIYTCAAADIHNPANWPGVVSFPPGIGNGLAMCDGRVIDYELEGFTQRDLDEMRFEFDDEAEPAWARF